MRLESNTPKNTSLGTVPNADTTFARRVLFASSSAPDDVRPTLKTVLRGDPPFTVLFDPDAVTVGGKYGTRLYPETWFIDKRGVVRARFDGAREWGSSGVVELVDEVRADIDRLLADSGIIRNRLKIEATTENARRIQALRQSHGSFVGWLEMHHPRPQEEWTRLFRQTFRFTGGQIVNEFLMSLGYLSGAHEPDCPVFARILEYSPPWARTPARV